MNIMVKKTPKNGGSYFIRKRCLSCKSAAVVGDGDFCLKHSAKEKISERNCLSCGRIFITNNPYQNFCDINCVIKHKTPKSEKEINFAIRWSALERDLFKCCYCGRNSSDGIILNVDHLIPKSKGGKYILENLVTSCHECNGGKSDKIISSEALEAVKSIINKNINNTTLIKRKE